MNNRILISGEYGSLNGGENSLLAILPGLMKSGWVFSAATPDPSDFSLALAQAGVQIHPFSMVDESDTRKSQEDIRSELSCLIDEIEPDLIHCNSLSTSRLWGPVARERGVPSLGYVRDILKLSKRAIADLNQLDRIIAVSKATRDWHCERGLNVQKTIVIYNGVDHDRFYPAPECDGDSNKIRCQLNIPMDAPVLLFVGQIGVRKGVDTMIEAFENIQTRIPPSHLLIVGQRHSRKQEAIEYEQRLKVQTQAMTGSGTVQWLGVRSDIPSLMRASTLLIHPARQEPLGRVLLEAAASGLPMVTTRVGGSAEILNHGQFEKLLVPPTDPLALARITIDLINDSELRNHLGNSLREMSRQRFDIERCADQLNDQYSELLQNRSESG